MIGHWLDVAGIVLAVLTLPTAFGWALGNLIDAGRDK